MEAIVQHGNYFTFCELSTYFPLPLLDTNEICIIAGARDMRKITFGNDPFLSGECEERQPWQISALSHLSGDISVTDMGEWTRCEMFHSNLLYGQWNSGLLWHLLDLLSQGA